MDDTSPYTVEATETSLRILEALVQSEEPMGVTALADRVGVSKSVVHNHLSTLRAHGFILKDDSAYRPSLRPLYFGTQIRNKMEIVRAAKRHLDNLAAATDETTALFVLEETDCVPAYVATTADSWEPQFQEGERLPLHMSAPGKALLSSLSDERVESILDETELTAATAATLTEPAELTSQLRQVRDDGIAFCRGEQFPGIVGVGAPIPVTTNGHVAAIGVCGPEERLNGRYLEEDITGQVVSTAKSIQVELTNG